MERKLLLVDANVISNALNITQAEAYKTLFESFDKDYEFALTGYTKYELVRSADKDHRVKYDQYIDDYYTYVSLSKELLDFASKLSYLYSKYPSTKGKVISVGDIVNAAFCIIKNCPIITIDNNDYPAPFFQEISRKHIEYVSKKGNRQIDTITLLMPDKVVLTQASIDYEV
jgi:predicted nucleic acid-binding protein